VESGATKLIEKIEMRATAGDRRRYEIT